MSARTLFFGVLTLSHADLSCKDLSCNAEDEESLMQTKVKADPLHSRNQVGPSMLLESVHGMAKQLMHDAQFAAIPEAMTQAVGSVNAALSMMEPELEEEHAHAQQQIHSQIDEIQACHSSEAHGTAVIAALADELSIMNQCIDDQTAAAAAQDRECTEWTAHATRIVFPATTLQNASPETAYNIALSLKDWVDDHWSLIESQRSECNEASTFAANEASRCSPVIADYDDKFCQHFQACSLQSACHLHEAEVYSTLIDESRVAMNARLARHRTLQHVRCVLGLITAALNTNMTISDSSLESCNGDDVAGNVDHLTLDFPSPQAAPECPATQSHDPQCSEVDLPQAWAGGEAEIPASAGTVMETGFEFYDARRCMTGPGTLGKPPGAGNHWSCVAFDTRTSIIPGGSGPQGFSYQCKPNHQCIVGLQQAGYNGANPVPSQPSTWDASTRSSFKEMYDAITAPEPCDSNHCANIACIHAVDVGWATRMGENNGVIANNYRQPPHGYYTEDSVFELLIEGDEIKWYKDGRLQKRESLATVFQGNRPADAPQAPLWVVAFVHDEDADTLFNFKYITAPGTAWQPAR